jgi:hypothetical protein
MFAYITDEVRLSRWLNGLVAEAEEATQVTVKKAGEGIGPFKHHLAWNAVALLVTVAKGFEAAGVLSYREGRTDVEFFDVVKAEAERRVLQDNTPNIASRSTSPAANIAEDAALQFWLELHRAFKAGEKYGSLD